MKDTEKEIEILKIAKKVVRECINTSCAGYELRLFSGENGTLLLKLKNKSGKKPDKDLIKDLSPSEEVEKIIYSYFEDMLYIYLPQVLDEMCSKMDRTIEKKSKKLISC